MKKNSIVLLTLCFCLVEFGCTEMPVSPNLDTALPTSTDVAGNESLSSSLRVNGASQVSGIGYYDAEDECDSGAHGATFAVKMSGDLEGCLLIFVDSYTCRPSGVYYEEGRELFVGSYLGESGSFWTTYKFEAKYEGCAEDGSYLGLEIFGRCQHPIVKGSGQGVFEGVTGRLDMKDDIEEGNYPYRGHFKF